MIDNRHEMKSGLLDYFILFIYVLNNFYFPVIYKFPSDIFINVLLIGLLVWAGWARLLKLLMKLREEAKKNFLITILFGIYVLLILSSAILNARIYYVYQLFRNIAFVVATLFILEIIDFKRVFIGAYTSLWLNNLIIIFKLIGLPGVDSFILRLSTIFGFQARFDYRTNGVMDGSLKAGLVSAILVFLTLYFITTRWLKWLAVIVLISMSIIQSRTAILLELLILFVYGIYIISKRKRASTSTERTVNTKIIIYRISIIISTLLALGLALFLLSVSFPRFTTSVRWQANEILNLGESITLRILFADALEVVREHFSQMGIWQILIGNGFTNNAGPNSVLTDNGFATLIVGIGIIGLTLLLLVHTGVFIWALKRPVLTRKGRFALLLLFSILILMNVKSTSFLSYHYFNLIVITSLLVICDAELSGDNLQEVHHG